MFVVRLFFSNRSFVLLLLPLFIGGMYTINVFTGYHQADEQLNLGLWGILELDTQYLDIIAPILIYVNAILLNTLFNRNEFMEKNNFITSLLYVLFTSFFSSFYHLSGFALAQTLMILTTFQIFKLSQHEDGRRAVFNASFLFSLGASLYPIMLLGIPLLFWIVWIIRPFVLRESLLLFTGLGIPLLYAAMSSVYFDVNVDKQHFSSSSLEVKWIDISVLGGAVFLLGVASLKGVLYKTRVSSIRFKKIIRVISLQSWLIVALVAVEFLAFKKVSGMSLLLFPLLFFLPYAFGDKTPRAFPTLIIYILFFFSVGKFFIPFELLQF